MVLMAVVRALAPEPLTFAGKTFSSRGGKFGAAALSAAGHALVVALVIWAFYGFRFSAFNPLLPAADRFIVTHNFIEQQLSLAGRGVQLLTAWHALPEGFLFGFSYVLKTVAARGAFLNGEYSVTGWPTFFPWAFLLKTTVPVLLITALIPALAARRWCAAGCATWRRDLYRVTPLIVLFTLYWGTSLTSHLNIGQRHLLPTYPVLFIAAGALGSWIASRKIIRVAAVAGLLGWQITESACIAPHYLAYFNELGGGPDNGWHHLVDSSLDWGQDLPSLKFWLDHRGDNAPTYLAYFGTGEPSYYGIKATRMSFLNNFRQTNPWYAPEAGWYCISATLLQQVYSPFNGEWRLEWEKEFQEARARDPYFREYWKNPAVRNDLIRSGTAGAFEEEWLRYDALRFARLCYYLRLRKPDANAGHSILIYRLSAAEVACATNGTLGDLRTLIENAVTAKR